MDVSVVGGNLAEHEADCLVVNLFEGVTEPAGATGALDGALDGAIRRLIASGDFTGGAGTTAMLYTNGQIPAARVLLVGLGPREKFDLHGVRRAAAVAAQFLRGVEGVRTMATIVHGAGIGGLDVAAAAQAVIEGTLLACYVPPQYKRSSNGTRLESCTVVEFSDANIEPIRRGVESGRAVAAGVYTARDLGSEPGNVLYPVEFAGRMQRMAGETGLRYTVLGEAEMRELGMGLLLAVSQGSVHEAQMIFLEHAPAGTESDPPLVLIGKGVTFDTGGISLKRSSEMWRMKGDMCGAAAVMGAMESIARLGVPRRVIGVATCVENMPDGEAYRPGDVVTGITGKTAEIISTDAEGRLALSDALGYVARFDPAAVVDLATLTGSVGVALGPQAAGLFSNSAAVQDALLAAAERSGERLWPFPMYDEYMDAIRSDIAEVKNSGGSANGVSTSAKFLEHFTEGYPWAHLDIARVSWTTNGGDAMTPKGTVGFGVRLLVELASEPIA